MSGTSSTTPQANRTPTTTENSVLPTAPMANGAPTNSPDPGHDAVLGNGVRPAPAPPAATQPKKGRPKKGTEPTDTSKLVAARIAALELDQAGDKEQAEEIERDVKRAGRELNSATAKMDNLQKIDHLTKRCNELFRDMKKHERDNIKNKKRADQLQKEKDQNRSELSKSVGLRDKLEKLCRELQRDNNKLKAEFKASKDSQVRNQNSWDAKYSELLQKLDDAQDDKDNPRQQVIDMEADELLRSRFKSMADQYDIRDLHFHTQIRTKELEVNYHMSRYEGEKKKAAEEAARARQLNDQVQTFSKTETELRHQLSVYVDKFKQVEDTLNNSNDLFLNFRKEMEEMSKKTKRLEKENENLKRKHDAMNGNIFKMAEERTKLIKDSDEQKKKEDKYRSIISQMQKQGRGIATGSAATGRGPHVAAATAAGHHATAVENAGVYEGEEVEVEGEDSEYDYEDEDEDDISDAGAEYGDDDDDLTEEEHPPVPPTFGPERPPAPAPAAVTTNGH